MGKRVWRVVDENRKVLGIVTDRDLFIALGTQNRRPAELTLSETMHPDPVVCTPDEDIREVLKTMATSHVRRLSVVDEGILQGVLSLDDVLARTNGALRPELMKALRSLSQAIVAE